MVAAPPKKQAKPKKLSYKEQKELDDIEGIIHAAEQEVESCQKKVEEPAVMADPESLNQWYTKLTASQEKVNHLYLRWEELEKKLAQLNSLSS